MAGGWPNPRQEQGDLPGAAAACTLPTSAKVERESRGRGAGSSHDELHCRALPSDLVAGPPSQ